MSESTPSFNLEITPKEKPSSWKRFANWPGVMWRGFSRAWLVTAQVLGSLFMGLVILALVAGLMGGGASSIGATEEIISGQGLDKIVVLSLEGTVGASSGGIWDATSGINTAGVVADLNQAASDPLVKGVILRINSPGGSAVVSDEIFEAIHNFKRDHQKPVVASLGDTAASGGYYIASAADEIVANPSTITGSIGVIMELYNAAGLMDKIGVESETIKSGSMKDIGSTSRATTDAERVVLQSVVDGAYSQFVDRVAAGRDMERSKVLELADGRVYTGGQAKENGLVDELGNLDTAVGLVKQLAEIDEATVVRFNRSGLWQSLLSGASNLPGLWLSQELSQMTKGQSGGLLYLWRM